MLKSKFREIIKDNANVDPYLEAVYEIEGTSLPLSLLLVSTISSKGTFLPFYFNDSATAEIHPEDFDKLNSTADLSMPEGWKIGKKIYDGTLEYDDLEEMVQDLKSWPYHLENYENAMTRIVGFRCPGLNRRWIITLTSLKNCQNSPYCKKFQHYQDREELLKDINTKPFFKESD